MFFHQAAGAVGIVVYNNEPETADKGGTFTWSTALTGCRIPVATLGNKDGTALYRGGGASKPYTLYMGTTLYQAQKQSRVSEISTFSSFGRSSGVTAGGCMEHCS